jgi:integrase
MSTLFQRGDWWYLQWFVCGKQKQKALKTKEREIAKKLQTFHDCRIAVGKAGIGSSRIDLFQAMDEFLIIKKPLIRPESHRRLREHLRNWFRFLEGAEVRFHLDLGAADVSGFVTMRQADGAAEKTIWEECSTMRAVIRQACADRNVAEPSFHSWPKLPKRPAHPERLGFYSPAELRALIDHFKGKDLGPVLAMGLFTGARLGELALLKVRDVDISNGIIKITQEKTGKTAAGMHRLVGIHPDLVETIRILVEGKPQGDPVLPQMSAHYRAWPREAIQDACAQMGIPYKRFHGLRHTFATFALVSGVSLRDLMDLIGHTNLSTTQKYLRQAQALQTNQVSKIKFGM